MPRREFLQLAKTYNPDKHNVAGHLISEKLDGTRCFWDGGITRGMRTEEVLYASIVDPKTGQRKKKIKPIATGLWSRYGNPVMAPDWFLDDLPSCPLDGELWAGRGNFQLCRSICGGDKPDSRFDQIKFMVYGMPPVERVFMDGEIKNSNFHCTMNGVVEWFNSIDSPGYTSMAEDAAFDDEYQMLKHLLEGREHVFAHEQINLPSGEESAKNFIEGHLEGILIQGGEGVVIRLFGRRNESTRFSNTNPSWMPKPLLPASPPAAKPTRGQSTSARLVP